MLADRWLSVCLVAAGVTMVVVGTWGPVGEAGQRFMTFVGLDCLIFSIVGFFYPRSNSELKHQATEFLQFAALAVSSFAAVAMLVFVAFGAPSHIGGEVFSTSLALGLAAALIVPILAKQFTMKIRTKP